MQSRITREASMPIAISDGPNLLAQRMGITQPGSPPVLLNHPVQSTVAIDGWKSVLFGLPFFPAGVGIVCAALNGSKNAPDWLIGLIGGGFFSAGALLIIHGLRGAACQAVYQREATEHPGEPWLVDHHWRREGIPFSAFNAMLGRFVAAAGLERVSDSLLLGRLECARHGARLSGLRHNIRSDRSGSLGTLATDAW